MKSIKDWNGLREYGIICLTGEACGVGLRLLCDVTIQGRAIIEKVLGCQVTLSPCWNCGPNTIGSIMLPHDLRATLCIFALLENGCKEVWQCNNDSWNIMGCETDEEVERARHLWSNCGRSWKYRGTAGDRNRHEFTGRVA